MDHDLLLVTIALNAWHDRVARVQQLLTTLADEQLLREIAPGKNRGIYLIGTWLRTTTPFVPSST